MAEMKSGLLQQCCGLFRRQASLHACRYVLEKEKYVESLKQELPTPPPPSGLEYVTPLFEADSKQRTALVSAPKRPRTAYILFSMDFRKTLDSSISFNNGTKLVSLLWLIM